MFGNDKRFISLVGCGGHYQFRTARFSTKVKTMAILFQLRDSVNVIREFVAPATGPSAIICCGPGPACAARTGGR
ncbi:hypothetical protein VXQ18_01605 [Brucella abortus]|nr:hypothetical protein [Brucella abortus]